MEELKVKKTNYKKKEVEFKEDYRKPKGKVVYEKNVPLSMRTH